MTEWFYCNKCDDDVECEQEEFCDANSDKGEMIYVCPKCKHQFDYERCQEE